MVKNLSLFFIRHGKLFLLYKDHSEMPFGVLADLASEKLSPQIDKKFTRSLIKQITSVIPFKKLKRIYTSPSRRCQETAVLISDFIIKNFKKKIKIITVPELKEISFNLNKIKIPLMKNRNYIEAVNNAVFLAMIEGKNCEPISRIYRRVERIFKKIIDLDQNDKFLFITHDFFMRVIEIYIRRGGKIYQKITSRDLKGTKRNYYLHGFATDYILSRFFPF